MAQSYHGTGARSSPGLLLFDDALQIAEQSGLEPCEVRDNRFRCRCPIHNGDGVRTLSVREADNPDVGVVFNCHKGCDGLTVLSWFREEHGGNLPPANVTPIQSIRTRTIQRNGAASETTRSVAKIAYPYLDAAGDLKFEVTREDLEVVSVDGEIVGRDKKIRQRMPDGNGGYLHSVDTDLYDLYHLDAIANLPDGGNVIIVEGEKCADAINDRIRADGRIADTIATTAPGGAGKWQDRYSQHLRGMNVAILPDNDGPGFRHAQDIATSTYRRAASVSVVDLDDLPDKGDVVDWFNQDPDRGILDLLERIEGTSEWRPDDGASFPAGVYPDEVERYLESGNRALGAPQGTAQAVFLAIAGAAIGNGLRIETKQGMHEKPGLFIGLIGPSGVGKTPIVLHALQPLASIQSKIAAAYTDEKAIYKDQVRENEAKPKAERVTITPPTFEKVIVTDATVEACARDMQRTRGLLMMKDELSGFFTGMDKYRSSGDDRQKWLEIWSGSDLIVSRASDENGVPLHVADPVASMIGGIQPAVLPKIAKVQSGMGTDGMLARFLFVAPEWRPQRWTEDGVDLRQLDAVTARLARIRENAKPGEDRAVVKRSAEAREVFREFYDNYLPAQNGIGLRAEFVSKRVQMVTRIALVLHALKHPDDPRQLLTGDTMRDAVRVWEFFYAQLDRVIPLMGDELDTGDPLASRIFKRLNEVGDWVSRRDIQRSIGNGATSAEVAAALAVLEDGGLAETRKHGVPGKRKAEQWRVVDGGTR